MNSLPTLTRRDFLKRAAIAGAAPFILPAAIRAAPTSPNNQITVGHIGLGTQGRALLGHCLGRNELRVVAVCDVDAARRDSASKMVEDSYADATRQGAYKGCAAFNDFRDLIARKDIDAVVIATPDHWHALIAIAAAHDGKDIYCEKPLSHTVREGQAMVKATRRKQRIFQVGSMQRSAREFRHACELVRNGVIGTIQTVDVGTGEIPPPKVCDLPGEPMESGLDWDFWLGDAPQRPYNSILSPRGVYDKNIYPFWRYYREYGSGGVGDWGAHHFDIVQWALGFDNSGPVEFIPAADPNAESGVRYRYATGVEVTHLGVDGTPHGNNGITFYGSNGKLYVNRGKFKLWLGDKLITDDALESEQILKDHLPANAIRLYNSSNHLTDWINSMHTRRPPICDVEIGHRTATICELVNVTYWHHQRLQWDPHKERFVGGAGNPQWLGQEYRKPWHLS
jgi:predicted dehydrogenase